MNLFSPAPLLKAIGDPLFTEKNMFGERQTKWWSYIIFLPHPLSAEESRSIFWLRPKEFTYVIVEDELSPADMFELDYFWKIKPVI